MKKHLNILLLLAVVLFGLSSCEDDKEPVLQKPTNFVLNTPATANLHYQLSSTGTVGLTFSQPDYGNPVVATYSVQVSLTEDFKVARDLEGTYTQCKIDVPDSYIADAINRMNGVTKESEYVDLGSQPVYLRVRSVVVDYPDSEIYSNPIKLESVQNYFYLRQPGVIYLVGGASGWVEPVEANADKYVGWTLSEAEDAIDSKIYTGTFTIKQADASFRFYAKLSGWGGDGAGGSDSYGPNENDGDNLVCPWDAKSGYSGAIKNGKGNYDFTAAWPTEAKVKIEVNLKAGTIKITPAE